MGAVMRLTYKFGAKFIVSWWFHKVQSDLFASRGGHSEGRVLMLSLQSDDNMESRLRVHSVVRN